MLLVGAGVSVVAFTLLGLVPDLESWLVYDVMGVPLSPDSIVIQLLFTWPAVGMYAALGAGGRLEGVGAVAAGLLCGFLGGSFHYAAGLWEPTHGWLPHVAVDTVTCALAAGGAMASGSGRRLAGALLGGAAAGVVTGLAWSPLLNAALLLIYGEGLEPWVRSGGVAMTWMVFGGLSGVTFWSLVPLGERLFDPPGGEEAGPPGSATPLDLSLRAD